MLNWNASFKTYGDAVRTSIDGRTSSGMVGQDDGGDRSSATTGGLPRADDASAGVVRAAAFWHGAAPLSRAPRSVEMVWSAPRDYTTGSSEKVRKCGNGYNELFA